MKKRIKNVPDTFKYWSNSCGDCFTPDIETRRDLSISELPRELQVVSDVWNEDTGFMCHLTELDGNYGLSLVNLYDHVTAKDMGMTYEEYLEEAQQYAEILTDKLLYDVMYEKDHIEWNDGSKDSAVIVFMPWNISKDDFNHVVKVMTDTLINILADHKWFKTDDMQWCRKIGPRHYELIEANEIDGKYIISEADEVYVDPEDRLSEKTLSIIRMYYSGGYDELVSMNPDKYDRQQQIAEMVYEQTSSFLSDKEYGLLTEEQANSVLEYYASNGTYPDEGYILGWHVTDIEWDIDKEEFSNEAEYDAIVTNVLPVESYIIPGKEMDEIAEELSDAYGYCVRTFYAIPKTEG